MKQGISRRGLLGAAAALPSAAQVQSNAAAPSSPEEELKAARAQLRSNIQQLEKVKLPATTEPATHFKA